MLNRVIGCQHHHADAGPAADHLGGGERDVLDQLKVGLLLRVNRVHKQVLGYHGLGYVRR